MEMALGHREQLSINNLLRNGWLEAGEGGPRQGIMKTWNSSKQNPNVHFQPEKLSNIQNVFLI